MPFYRFLPTPSERMGVLWTLSTIKDACIVEYGPAGTTHYGIESYSRMNSSLLASVYTTHIEEEDIVMGDPERLEKVITEVDEQHRPNYIFVIASSVSSIIGADVKAICIGLKDRVNARLIEFSGGGFKGNYNIGCKDVLTCLANNVIEKSAEPEANLYNIIGSNIDCYNFESDLAEIENLMLNCFGMRLNSVFTSVSSLNSIAAASNAGINIVLRAEGLECAEIMKDRFSIPYHYGLPYGYDGTYKWLQNIKDITGRSCDKSFLNKQRERQKDHMLELKYFQRGRKPIKAVISGNFDTALGIAGLLRNEFDVKCEAVFINHENNLDIYSKNLENVSGLVSFNTDEVKKKSIIASMDPEIVMGDSFLFRIAPPNAVKILVSNPNTHMRLLCSHTPYVGFKGADFILERIINTL
jgi:nitrogenase molybdenum-iron protein alpha/beta subunit